LKFFGIIFIEIDLQKISIDEKKHKTKEEILLCMNERKFEEIQVDFSKYLHVYYCSFVRLVSSSNIVYFDLPVLFHDPAFYDGVILEIVDFEFVID
jgi:hypothetical protein